MPVAPEVGCTAAGGGGITLQGVGGGPFERVIRLFTIEVTVDQTLGPIFLNLPNPSSRTMALGSTQPLTEMSQESSWV
jgi:hypothetical protein